MLAGFPVSAIWGTMGDFRRTALTEVRPRYLGRVSWRFLAPRRPWTRTPGRPQGPADPALNAGPSYRLSRLTGSSRKTRRVRPARAS